MIRTFRIFTSKQISRWSGACRSRGSALRANAGHLGLDLPQNATRATSDAEDTAGMYNSHVVPMVQFHEARQSSALSAPAVGKSEKVVAGLPDTDRIWASTEEASMEQATVSSAVRGHWVHTLLFPLQQGEGGDCWAIRHGVQAQHPSRLPAHRTMRTCIFWHNVQGIHIRQVVLCSRSASYDD
ncbi:hypothetical protein B0H13DRAFT_2514342 [Mycena leptocephala]|nr:hypothetical protein B0H13DRAFT_2514342 [Mycena leptocephala]